VGVSGHSYCSCTDTPSATCTRPYLSKESREGDWAGSETIRHRHLRVEFRGHRGDPAAEIPAFDELEPPLSLDLRP
jgi:hypothetical protein